jgi:CPA2 family monovalent cation:H+ antiporter-2
VPKYDAYELIDHKVEHIYRETLYSAVNMGVDALVEWSSKIYTDQTRPTIYKI